MSSFDQDLRKDIEHGKQLVNKCSESDARTYLDKIERKYSLYMYGLDGIYREAGRKVNINECTWSQVLESAIDVLETGSKTLQYVGGRLIAVNKDKIGNRIEVNNHNNNRSNATSRSNVSVNIDITTMFEQAKEDLDGVLSDEAYSELLTKISELEEIQSNTKGRGKKWSKSKGIFDWITTQGVDVGVKLLPIILRMMEQ